MPNHRVALNPMQNSDTHRPRRWPWYGLSFGIVLFVSALGSAGGGHGSYLPFTLFGTPLSLMPRVGLFAAPIWWGFIGWLLRSQRRRLAIVSLAIHTLSAGIVLWLGNPYEPGDEQWRYFLQVERIMPGWLWGGLLTYGTGLLIAWSLTINAARGVTGRIPVTPPAGPTSD
jgi:hypothetical protein